jgi:hypothetical protein
VTFQEAPSGSTTYTDIATDTASPYSASWDTTTVANGAYTVRAVITDAAGNSTTTATVAVTVNNSFTVGVPGGSRTAGGTFTATVTAVANTTTNTNYTGAHGITFTGPSNAPDGTAPAYPTAAPTFANGVATVSITLYKKESTTLTATAGFLTGASSSFTINEGPAGGVVFSSSTPTLSCTTSVFQCTLSLGKGATWTASVTLTDTWGNLGPKSPGNAATIVNVATSQNRGSLSTGSVTIAKNTAESGSFTYTAGSASGNNSESVTASSGTFDQAVDAITVH